MNALTPRTHAGARSLPAQVQQLVVMALMVALLALLAVGAVLHTAPEGQVGYLNGSFGTDQRANYGMSLDRRISPQRSASRG